MSKETMVTSLEVSRKLRKAGVKQESYFYHMQIGIGDTIVAKDGYWDIRHSNTPMDEYISAYLSHELLEKLTNEEIENYIWKFKISVHNVADLFRDVNKLAEVLLWCIENKKLEDK